MIREEDISGRVRYSAQERTVHEHPIAVDNHLTFYGFSYLVGKTRLFYWLDRAIPEVIAGQDSEREELLDFATNAPPGSIATVVGPFGSGKTALVNGLVGELVHSGAIGPHEIHRITQDTIYGESLTPEEILQTRTTFDPSKHMPDTMPRVVFIEEIERNNDPQANELSFRNISELRAGLFAPRIIVTGEDTLRDPRFFELIGADPKDVLQVDMPRLTGEILNEALRKRLVYLFGDQARGLNINIFAPEVLNALIPNTDPPIATMRDTFSYIKQLSEYFKFGDKEKAEKPVEYDQPTFIDGQLFGRAIRSIHQGEVSPEQNALFQYIRAQYDPNFPFKPLMVEKLIELFGIDVDLSVEDPRKRALRERSLLQNLESIGLMEVRDSKLSPKPILEREFLPTVESFVRAAFVTTSMGEEL